MRGFGTAAKLLLVPYLFSAAAAASATCNVRNSEGCAKAAAVGTATPGTVYRFNMFSYTVNGTYQWIYDWGPFDLLLQSSAPLVAGAQSYSLNLTGVNTYKLEFTRVPDAVLPSPATQTAIKLTGSRVVTPAGVSSTPVEQAAENRLVKVLQAVDILSFSADSRKVSFAGGNLTAAFDQLPLTEPVFGQEWDGLQVDGKVLSVVPATYLFQGAFASLWGSTPTFPVNVELAQESEKSIIVVLRAIDIHIYRFTYNVADGWVEKIDFVSHIPNGATAAQLAVGKKMVDIVANTQQIAFENRNLVQFITDSGSTRVSFATAPPAATSVPSTPSGGRRRLAAASLLDYVPGSYLVNGVPSNVPGTLQLRIENDGTGLMRATLRGATTDQTFRISYNNADGWVNTVSTGPIFATGTEGAAAAGDSAAVEKAVSSLMGRTQQVAMESDGMVQFVTDYGATRIAFKAPTTTTATTPAPPTHEVLPYTLQINGQMATALVPALQKSNLYMSLQQPATGVCRVVLSGPMDGSWEYKYNAADGWVSSSIRTDSAPAVSSSDQPWKDQVTRILDHVNQIAFEKDGQVQFISNYGQDRVSFALTAATTPTTASPIVTPSVLPLPTPTMNPTTSGEGTYAVRADTYQSNGVTTPLYDSAVEFPLTLSFTQGATQGDATFTLYGIDTFSYHVQYNVDNGAVNSVIYKMDKAGSGRTDQRTTSMKIQNILATLETVTFAANGDITFSSKGKTSQITFTKKVAATRPFGRRLQQQTEPTAVLQAVPSTYTVNGIAAPLFHGPEFPIQISFVPQGAVGDTQVWLQGGNLAGSVYYKYNVVDGWVSQISTVGLTGTPFSPDADIVMSTVFNLMLNCQQLAFETDGRVQFIAHSGADRLAFDPVPFPNIRKFHVGSYIQNGKPTALAGASNFTVSTVPAGEGKTNVTLSAVSDRQFTVTYNPVDGWVSEVKMTVLRAVKALPSAQTEAETKVVNIIANVQQLAWEKDGLLQFITDDGATRISFRPFAAAPGRRLAAVPEILTVLPETYVVNGTNTTSLFSGPEFPVTLQVTPDKVGSAKLVLEAVNVLTTYVKYNNADGWVSSVGPVNLTTSYQGTPDQNATETRLISLVQKMQQIAFEDDGRIQLIANNGADRLTFGDAGQNKTLVLLPETYQYKGKFVSLFPNATQHFPITLRVTEASAGGVNATLHAVNALRYKITYNNADGWVKSITPSKLTYRDGTMLQKTVEGQVANVLANAQQIAFESDGRVQFITDSGATRLSFGRPSELHSRRRRLSSATFAPDPSTFFSLDAISYSMGGFSSRMFADDNSTAALLAIKDSQEQGMMDLAVVMDDRVWKFTVSYGSSDDGMTKRVYSVVPADVSGIDKLPLSPKETVLYGILLNLEQIAVDAKSGALQVISNHGLQRCAFIPATGGLSSGMSLDILGSSNTSMLPEKSTNKRYKLIPTSYVHRKSSTPGLFDKTPVFPVSFTLQQNAIGDITVTLTVVNTLEFNIKYNNADGWVTSVSHKTVSGPPDSIESSLQTARTEVETRIKNVLANTQQVSQEANGVFQFITDGGETRIAFIPASMRRRLAAEADLFEAVPSSYQVNGKPAELYHGPAFPITITTTSAGVGLMNLTMTAVNEHVYTIKYNNADGWVTSVAYQGLAKQPIGGTPDQLTAEERVRNLIVSAQQISFDDQGHTIQIIGNKGADRLMFAESPDKRLVVLPETYLQNGVYKPLFNNSTVLFPVTLTLHQSAPGTVTAILQAINRSQYNISYNEADGWVSSIKHRVTEFGHADTTQVAVDTALRNILANAQQLAFESDGRVQFITDGGKSRVTFAPSSRRRLAASTLRQVIDQTYQVGGEMKSLFEGMTSTHPVQIKVTNLGVGKIDVEVIAVDAVSYRVNYNNADGWVSSVEKTAEKRAASGMSRLAQDRVTNIVSRVQQVAVENDGRVQFITDNGATRFACDYSGTITTRRVAVLSTYTENGKLTTLVPAGVALPITLDVQEPDETRVLLTLHTTRDTVMEFAVNKPDGWVVSRKVVSASTGPALDAMRTHVETKLKSLFDSAQQLAFEADGRLQVIANNGLNRLSFDMAAKRRLAEVLPLDVLPETYQVNSTLTQLFVGPRFPISATVETTGVGAISITLTGANTYKFAVRFNNADGWVSKVTADPTNPNFIANGTVPSGANGTPDQLKTEARVIKLLANLEQISFELDGRVQFISHSGADRLSFGESDDLLTVLPSTYQVDGAPASLFQSQAIFPVTLSLERNESEESTVNATLHVVNTLTYVIKYNEKDGWVESIKPRLVATGSNVTEAQKAVETKLKNIMANTQQLAFEKDGRIQFITDSGASRISFGPALEAHKTTRRMLLDASTVFTIVPEIIQGGKPVKLFPDDQRVVPVQMTIRKPSSDTLSATLTGMHTYQFDVSFTSPSSGEVSNVKFRQVESGPMIAIFDEAVLNAETRIKNIMANMQYVDLRPDSVAFFADNYQSRVGFLADTFTSDLAGLGLDGQETPVNDGALLAVLDTTTLISNGTYSRIPRPARDVTLEVSMLNGSTLQAVLGGASTSTAKFAWNPIGGRISSVELTTRTPTASSLDAASAEARVLSLMERATSLTFTPESAIVLAGDNLMSRVLFRGLNSLSRRRLLQQVSDPFKTPLVLDPGSYVLHGTYTQLAPPANMPRATLQFDQTAPGAVILTLHALNTFVYDVRYNNADGWVSSVIQKGASGLTAPGDVASFEAALSAILRNVQQLGIEDHGYLQLITDHGATRVSFYASDNEQPAVHIVRGVYSAINTAVIDGVGQSLLGSGADSAKITLTTVNDEVSGLFNATLRAVGVKNYSLKYNPADGWVDNCTTLPDTPAAVSTNPALQAAESKLDSILRACEQIVFEADGKTITFTSADGANRVSFTSIAPTTGRRLRAARTAIPGSYVLNGQQVPLYENSYFPIALDVTETGVGQVSAVLRGLPGSRTYDIRYNNADGWVTSSTLVRSIHGSVPDEQARTFSKAADLMTAVQQLGFNPDGSLQIIAGNGASRLTFA